MRHDEPATMMHLIRPLLLLLAVLTVLLLTETAAGNTLRIFNVAGSDGPDIMLAQVAELEGEYANAYAGVVVGRFEDGAAKVELATSDILKAMQEGGARLGMIDLKGFGKCTVHRTFNSPQRIETTSGEPPAANIDERAGSAITLQSPTTVRLLIEQSIAKEIGIGLGALHITFEDRDAQLLAQSAVAGRYEVTPISGAVLGQVAFEVQGYTGTQRQGKPATVRARVSKRVLAVIASDAIPRGEMITRRRVRIGEVLIDDETTAYLQETTLVTGQIASQAIKPGELVTSASVELPVAVKRRQRVTVQLATPGVKITFNGIAQDEGVVGESIEILNPVTKERFVATVVGRGKVVAGGMASQAKENER